MCRVLWILMLSPGLDDWTPIYYTPWQPHSIGSGRTSLIVLAKLYSLTYIWSFFQPSSMGRHTDSMRPGTVTSDAIASQ